MSSHDRANRQRRARMQAKAEARKTGVPGEEVQQPHDPILETRPFSSVDFSQMVSLMPPEWLFDGMTEAEQLAQAQMDLSGILAQSNIRIIATIDDGTDYDPAMAGYALGFTHTLPLPADAALWSEGSESAAEQLQDGGHQARMAYKYVRQLADRGELLLRAAGVSGDSEDELVLFVVSPDHRGSGVGKALVAAFEDRLRELGQTSYLLQTDTSCSWEWYDAHGFTRLADIELSDDFPMPPGLESPATISDAPEPGQDRAFLYRKELSTET